MLCTRRFLPVFFVVICIGAKHFVYLCRTARQQDLCIKYYDMIYVVVIKIRTHRTDVKSKLNIGTKAAQILALFTFLVASTASISLSSQPPETVVPTHATIIYWPRVDVNINPTEKVGTNNLSLGFMVYHEWQNWLNRPVLRQLAEDANFQMVRLFTDKIEPCTNWDESTKTGTFSWTDVDSLVDSVFAVGAEPLICIGRAEGIEDNLPQGMTIDPATGWPIPESWGAYCAEWIKHFKQAGKPIRYYEIINEPWVDGGFNTETKIANYMAVFNAAAQAMRAEDPSILLGFDGSSRRHVLDYWLENGGADLDFISFHKYDSNSIGQYTDEEMFVRAETHKLDTSSFFYGVADARQTYYNARGKMIPVINSESNINCAWKDGTDPKIQQMMGAVWTALVLRSEILKDLRYNIYNRYTSGATWAREHKTSGGAGMGMINSDDNQPWYPYYVQWMLGTSMSVGDSIVKTTSSSDEIRVLSWIHEGEVNILLICKVDQPRTVFFHGVTGQLHITKIDNTISWETPSTQTSIVESTEAAIVSGYTVMLLQGL